MANYRNYLPLMLVLVLVVFSFLTIQPFLKAVFLGAIIAYMFYPFYSYMKSKRLKSTLSAIIICFIVLLIFVIPSVFFAKTLVQESYSLFIIVKQKLSVGIFSNCQSALCEKIQLLVQNPETNHHIQETAKTITTWVVQKSSDFLVSVPRIILNLFVMFFSLFYFLKEGKQLLNKVEQYLNMKKRRYTRALKRLKEITHGITYGYLVIAIVQGTLGGIGFYIFGVSSPIFWGILMAFLSLVPYLGAGLVWGPASLILFVDGLLQDSNSLMVKGVLLFAYSAFFVSTLDNFIRPKFMGDKAKIHPMVVMLGIFGGLFFFGALGVIIGPLLLSFTIELIEMYLEK